MTEWINVSSMPFWFVTENEERYFLRSPECNDYVPTKDHIWWSSFYYHWKVCVWLSSGQWQACSWQATKEKCQGEKRMVCFFAAVLRIATNHCFQSSNFLRNHVNVGIRWRYFTGANPFKLTSLLTFVCILRYISFNLHQFSLHIFQCDCRSCVIYVL